MAVASAAAVGDIPARVLAVRIGRAAIAEGGLVQLYPHIHIREESSLSLLYPGRRLVPKKTQAFMDFLRSVCARQHDLS